MENNGLERITPTKENLADFFAGFPDHQQRYEFALDRIDGNMMVADMACGVGYGTWLMSKKAGFVIGVDISESALEHANANFTVPNNKFVHGDEYIFQNEFDVVISFETIEHMDEKDGDAFLQKIRKSLKPNGRLIMSTPINKTDNKHNVSEFHIREYDDIEFPEKLKSNGFEILEMYGQGSPFHEKLYGKGGKAGIFGLMKFGIHRILPTSVRNFLKSILMGDPNQGLQIKKDNWQNSMIQIAVCKVK
jgi:SAM-dependent methyltransferase